jgi:hypothetical protein
MNPCFGWDCMLREGPRRWPFLPTLKDQWWCDPRCSPPCVLHRRLRMRCRCLLGMDVRDARGDAHIPSRQRWPPQQGGALLIMHDLPTRHGRDALESARRGSNAHAHASRAVRSPREPRMRSPCPLLTARTLCAPPTHACSDALVGRTSGQPVGVAPGHLLDGRRLPVPLHPWQLRRVSLWPRA